MHYPSNDEVVTYSILFAAIFLAGVTLTGKGSRPFATEPGSAGGTLGKKSKPVSGGGTAKARVRVPLS